MGRIKKNYSVQELMTLASKINEKFLMKSFDRNDFIRIGKEIGIPYSSKFFSEMKSRGYLRDSHKGIYLMPKTIEYNAVDSMINASYRKRAKKEETPVSIPTPYNFKDGVISFLREMPEMTRLSIVQDLLQDKAIKAEIFKKHDKELLNKFSEVI